jgi:hypothetical protein
MAPVFYDYQQEHLLGKSRDLDEYKPSHVNGDLEWDVIFLLALPRGPLERYAKHIHRDRILRRAGAASYLIGTLALVAQMIGLGAMFLSTRGG